MSLTNSASASSRRLSGQPANKSPPDLYVPLMRSPPPRSRIHMRSPQYSILCARRIPSYRAGQQERFVEKIEEQPSCPSNLVIVGRNSRGNWVAQEQNGLFGGLFVSRAQAVKYALFENGQHPETIILTT